MMLQILLSLYPSPRGTTVPLVCAVLYTFPRAQRHRPAVEDSRDLLTGASTGWLVTGVATSSKYAWVTAY
jgi:hypothetical protein